MAKSKTEKIPHYELLYIISNQYTEDEAGLVIKNVRKIIENNGGKITYEENWGKKKLAYPIGHFSHGYYNLFEFDVKGEKMTKIDKDLRMSREVLRHQIVNKEFRSVEEIEMEKKKSQEKQVKEVKAKEQKENFDKEKQKGKVSLKELDEKLDRILETDDLL